MQRAGARYCHDRCRLRAHRGAPGKRVHAEISVSGTPTPSAVTSSPSVARETDKHSIPRASEALSRPLDPRIVPDSKWPGMYRIRLPGGGLSDMLNLTRARDALLPRGCS